MKRIILSSLAIAAVMLSSCKKDEVESIELGMATINGTVRADIDQTNDVNGAGVYDYYSNPEGVEGMTVRAFVYTGDYYQHPDGGYNYDTEVYTATTDASGKFTLEIPATQEGFGVTLEFEDVNGVSRVMYTTDGSNLVEVSIIEKDDEWVYIYDGANLDLVFDADDIYEMNDNAHEYGTAELHGTVHIQWDITSDAPGPISDDHYLFTSATGVTLQQILMTYEDAPYGDGYDNVYSFDLNADGTFVLTVVTETAGLNDVDVDFGFQDFIGPRVRNNVAGTADSVQQVRYQCTNDIHYYDVNTIYPGDIKTGYNINIYGTPF